MKRRKAREEALKILYMLDIKNEITTKDIENLKEKNENIKNYTYEVVKGVLKNCKEIDKIIADVSLNWEIKRMGFIERNILRISTYEIVFRNDIPPAVSINEAIEISKKYGDEESPRFINGILHKIKELYKKEEK